MANSSQNASDALNEAEVERFLEEHPEFLAERPELLRQLSIPHPTPAGVSSLIERQVEVLRADNQRQRRQLETLTDSQVDSRALTEQVHRLVLDMLQAHDPNPICELLDRCLHQDYAADAATLFLFLNDRSVSLPPPITVRERNDKLRLLLAELFNRGKPLIDSLQAEHLPLMFGDAGDNIHSSVLLPVFGHQWEGLLVLGSEERDRYRQGPAIELLVFITQITALKLDEWLQTDGQSAPSIS